jgi:hypothetical protein
MENNKESTWEALASVNCNGKIEKKGNLSYLSWAFAWAEVKKRFPDAEYSYKEPTFYGDGSCEVQVSTTIKGQTYDMWLPVMDNRNNAIKNPDSRKISDARMRCLVKCLAMHGLAHYIYAGEDIPDAEVVSSAIQHRFAKTIEVIKEGLAQDDLHKAAEAWFELGNDEKQELFVAESKGGPFSHQERTVMKTAEFREAFYGKDGAA